MFSEACGKSWYAPYVAPLQNGRQVTSSTTIHRLLVTLPVAVVAPCLTDRPVPNPTTKQTALRLLCSTMLQVTITATKCKCGCHITRAELIRLMFQCYMLPKCFIFFANFSTCNSMFNLYGIIGVYLKLLTRVRIECEFIGKIHWCQLCVTLICSERIQYQMNYICDCTCYKTGMINCFMNNVIGIFCYREIHKGRLH